MDLFLRLSDSVAIPLWNKFLSSFSSPVPFSFNPSLFDFYMQYFHWKPYYVMLFSEDIPFAVFPVVNTGRSWVSLPHFSYGGFVAIRDDGVEWNENLLQQLIFIIQNEKLNPGFYQVNIKSIFKRKATMESTFIRTLRKHHQDDNYFKISSVFFLPETSGDLFRQLNANLRRKIHKAANSGFNLQIGGKELLDSFLGLYSRKMHRLGSPAYGKDFFRAILETYRFGEVRIFLIKQAGKVVGASFLQSYQRFYESSWFATDNKAYKNYVSDFLHAQMIQYAISKGASVYSFGRSTPNSGVHQYKSHWPVVDIPVYQYEQGIKIQIKNYSWLSGIWKTIPYPLAKIIGPKLVKYLY